MAERITDLQLGIVQALDNVIKRDATVVERQQLVARIKKTSKYAHQAPKGGWFDVRVVPDMGYGLRGNDNNYRFCDVVFGVRLDDGTIVELKG